MRTKQPFLPADLDELDRRLLSRADAVVALEDVHDGKRGPGIIGLRHDVDAGHALATAVKMAVWEAERGYRATYFILHTSPYWGVYGFRDALDQIVQSGHEIGIHTNALAEALRTGRDPDEILKEALETLRGYGHTIRGVAGHGDQSCSEGARFINDEQFVECARPKEGEPDREIKRGSVSLTLEPRPLADFGLEYEAYRLGLPSPWRTSDSGGEWFCPFDETVAKFEAVRRVVVGPDAKRQLHLLVHPDWWGQAFSSVAVAA